MTSTLTDRFSGVRSGVAYKAPCRVATTANITLSGFQTIAGVTLASGDSNLRVLVKDQTTGSENGIWLASSGAWSRAKDFDSSTEVMSGTQVLVTSGTGSGTYQLTTADPITIGTTSLTFTAIGGSGSVTSVTVSGSTGLTSSGSPITTSGTITLTLADPLKAIGGLTASADQIAYFTGADTAGVTDLTSAARSLLDDTTISAMRTTLGVALGSDVQAYSARLSDIGAISWASGDVLYFDGANLVKLAAGTSGQYLKTLGVGSAPAWDSPSASATPVPTVTACSSSATWTKPSGCRSVRVTAVGGGGGGGSTPLGTATTMSLASGGGAGAVGTIWLDVSSTSISTVAVTVSTGGAGAAASTAATGIAGSAGTPSSFGAYLSAPGGSAGGAGMAAGTTVASIAGGAGGAAASAGGGATLLAAATGASGQSGVRINGTAAYGGGGGSSPYGGGGADRANIGGAGNPGSGYGSGGGGAVSRAGVTAAAAGGNGAGGIVVIEEFY